jgi:hypothetical protein
LKLVNPCCRVCLTGLLVGEKHKKPGQVHGVTAAAPRHRGGVLGARRCFLVSTTSRDQPPYSRTQTRPGVHTLNYNCDGGGVSWDTKHAQLRGREFFDAAGVVEIESSIYSRTVGSASCNGESVPRRRCNTRERTTCGYILDARPVPSTSKRVFDRCGRHRRNWRQVHSKIVIT